MRNWEFKIALDPQRRQALFLQLAGAIADAIHRGRLKPGDPLPGTRELAGQLGVNRNTVIASYRELVAEGLLISRVGCGTFVAHPLTPPATTHPVISNHEPTFALASSPDPPLSIIAPKPGMLVLSRSTPDVRLLPSRALAQAFGRAIGQHGRRVITYTDPRGHGRLRSQLAGMLARTRGMITSPDDVLITRSIEHGLDLVARVLISPGDGVVVENLGYPPARRVMELAGARLLPIPVDQDGLDVVALGKLLEREPIRAVLLTPHHQFPTTVVMSAARRAQLSDLALFRRFAIIEDDYDHEFHYAGKPILPLATGAARANVIYVATMSNLLAPGLSTGFVVAPPPVMKRLVTLRAASDAQGDAAVECAIAELFEDGEMLRHVRRMRGIYANRRDALAAALARHLASALSFHIPDGGMALWARADEGIDVAAWSLAAEREGVLFNDSRTYDILQRDTKHMRLGFSFHDTVELDEAVRRMARALIHARAKRFQTSANSAAESPNRSQCGAETLARKRN